MFQKYEYTILYCYCVYAMSTSRKLFHELSKIVCA